MEENWRVRKDSKNEIQEALDKKEKEMNKWKYRVQVL